MIRKRINRSEVIALAWCDKTSFSDIQKLSGLSESAIIQLLRRNLKPSRFKLWRNLFHSKAKNKTNLK